MPAWLLALIPAAVNLIAKLFGGGESDARKEGRATGQAETRDAVSSDALKRTEEARKDKERTDAEVRRTGYDDRVDRL